MNSNDPVLTDIFNTYKVLQNSSTTLENTKFIDNTAPFHITSYYIRSQSFPNSRKGKNRGTNRPVDGAGCPEDIRLARTETECRCSVPTEAERSGDKKMQ